MKIRVRATKHCQDFFWKAYKLRSFCFNFWPRHTRFSHSQSLLEDFAATRTDRLQVIFNVFWLILIYSLPFPFYLYHLFSCIFCVGYSFSFFFQQRTNTDSTCVFFVVSAIGPCCVQSTPQMLDSYNYHSNKTGNKQWMNTLTCPNNRNFEVPAHFGHCCASPKNYKALHLHHSLKDLDFLPIFQCHLSYHLSLEVKRVSKKRQ